MEAIAVKNLTFRYPEGTDDVLRDVSFSVKQGAFATLCGLSGSGKSTLLRHLKPALAPHGTKTGSIRVFDRDLFDLTPREQSELIGFVQQSPDNQLVTDKVWHELAFGLESLGMGKEDMRRRIAETAAFFGIQHYFEADVDTLSGGQKQLLNLASVMAMQPKVIILDEPTSRLDPIAAAEFLACLLKINRELGTTVILTEHRLDEVLPLSDQVLVLENGAIISDDVPSRTGKNLRAAESGCFLSLPAPMRIWDAAECGDAPCPVTVTQGREWLISFSEKHPVKPLFPEEIPPHGETVLSLKDVWFRYKKDSPDVIKGLRFDLHRGELVTVMGGNGTGKSTLLSLLNGTNRPYRGKVISNKELCLTLPQEPQTLLNGKSVLDMLREMTAGLGLSREEEESRLSSVIGLCQLEHLLRRHPFDLSGGEMQKAAIAKLLLLKPAVLLLDEPTKGLDAQFKAVFAGILDRLTQEGTAVVMVSHDIEFCAAYSHRCLMMFNGELAAGGTPRDFFRQNSFYITSAARMARGLISDAVTAEDVIYCCTGQKPPKQPPSDEKTSPPELSLSSENKKTKLPLWKKLLGAAGGFLLVFAVLLNLGVLRFFPTDSIPLWARFACLAMPTVMLMLSLGDLSRKPPTQAPRKPKRSSRAILSAVMILLLIPLTIYIGNTFLYNQKYLFISLLVLFECMAPFFLAFEGRKPQPRELVLIAVMCALTVAGRAAFAALPQIKPVLALVIISGAAFGAETGFIIGAVGMLVSNIYFGQGAWTPWQMFAAGFIGFLAGLLFQKGRLSQGRAVLCTFGFAVTILIYGGVMNYSALVLSRLPITRETLLIYYAQGLPYDIIHAFSTLAFLFFFSGPMLEKLSRVKTKYGF